MKLTISPSGFPANILSDMQLFLLEDREDRMPHSGLQGLLDVVAKAHEDASELELCSRALAAIGAMGGWDVEWEFDVCTLTGYPTDDSHFKRVVTVHLQPSGTGEKLTIREHTD